MHVKVINSPSPLTIQVKNLAMGMYMGQGSLTKCPILLIVTHKGPSREVEGVYRYTANNAENKWFSCSSGNENAIIDPVLVDIEEIKLKIIK